MRDIVLGPTFEASLPSTADDAERALAEWIRSGGCPYDAARAGSHFTMSPRRETRHFWSPVLNLDLREENGVSLVAGRFNPSNGIWAGYMLTYLALATIAIGAAMWGTAELLLGRTPWSMLFIPACLVVAGLMFWASAVGQRIARPEMAAMRGEVCGVLGIEGSVEG
jgi:hypothetical protein